GEALVTGPQAAIWPDALQGDLRFLLQDLLEKAVDRPAFSNATMIAGDPNELVFAAAYTAGGNLLVGAFTPGDLIQHGLSWFTGPVAVVVVDRQNQVLYDNLTEFGHHLVELDAVGQAQQGITGIETTGAHGEELVLAYSPVAPLGWALLVAEPWQAIASPLLNATQYSPLVLLPLVLLALLALGFGVRQIVQPLQALEEGAAELAAGNFAAIRQPVGGIPEIRNLQAALSDTAEKLQIAQADLHGYIGALTAGVEQERRTLARELHDDTLQALIALNQRVQLAMLRAGEGPVQAALQEVQALADQTMTNLRRMVRGMRPIYLEDLGLSAALGMLAGERSVPGGLQIQFRQEGDERRLEPEAEMALYRMAQEALNNAARHSGGSQVWIVLAFENDCVRLTVRDDGAGFTVPERSGQFARKGHYGLLGMYERADLIGARLAIQSAPGAGTVVSVALDGPGG
ncbi:MAG TPA: sensor histidine kinase, partial [Anaerolineaceae bacterium]|nr:sensor histidine kinase [Anaerolineaceae bacterium]